MTWADLSMRSERYIFNSRVLTHVGFWLMYYVVFGFLWVSEGDYYRSFALEFVLMPIRICTAYMTMYWLMPLWLLREKTIKFLGSYLLLLLLAGFFQSLFTHFFHAVYYERVEAIWRITNVIRSMVLVNSTVILLSAMKMYIYWQEEKRKNQKLEEGLIEIRSDKRTYRVAPSCIQYIEGLGNYVTFYLTDRRPLISYMSMKECNETLSDKFVRIHKSFIVNTDHIESYTQENVEIGDRILPVGKSYSLSFVDS